MRERQGAREIMRESALFRNWVCHNILMLTFCIVSNAKRSSTLCYWQCFTNALDSNRTFTYVRVVDKCQQRNTQQQRPDND